MRIFLFFAALVAMGLGQVGFLSAESRFVSESGNIVFDAGLDGVNDLVVDIGGNVGVRVGNPSANLHVGGNADFMGNLVANGVKVSGFGLV